MATRLHMVDCTSDGREIARSELRLFSERISVRELIERRVREEVHHHNALLPPHFRMLVQPNDAEAELNGFRLRKPRMIDADRQVARALDAFETNGFFLFVNDKQLIGLDTEITATDDTVVQFLKLVPLVGG